MEDYYWLNEDSKLFLERGYLQDGVSTEKRVKQIAAAVQKYCPFPIEERIESYIAKGWYSLSTPVWSNFGLSRGLPISCFGSYIGDSTAQILEKTVEVGMMSKMGGGTSAYFGDIRARGTPISTGGKTDGPIRFMELFDKTTSVISQGGIRRGSFAAYMPIEHPDIEEFIRIREDGHVIQDMSIGITITDKWMEDLEKGVQRNRDIWKKILEKRYSSGYPYFLFSDTINNNAPEVYKKHHKYIHASNLCSEIALSSSEDESFVCCLSSLNLLHYNEWKNTDAPELLVYLLDAVMSEFIEKAEKIPHFEAAVKFAKSQRAIGVGVLGYHSFLQSVNVAFESMEAKTLNNQIHRLIRDKTLLASKNLASRMGEPELLKGTGRRNTTLMAIAPTTSSSFILGQVSPSIEPLNSNYFVKDLAKGKFPYRNPYLSALLSKLEKNTPAVWQSILIRGGSVQHLEFLSEHEKDVFKTFGEISQKEIIIQAASRQKYIDQSQSLNLMIPPSASPKEVSKLIIEAWKLGIKSLYYQRSANPAQELARSILTCKSCES